MVERWNIGFQKDINHFVVNTAGDPQSISSSHEIGLTYVSCSPYRVPVARLSVVHAALLDKNADCKKT